MQAIGIQMLYRTYVVLLHGWCISAW